MAFRDHTATTKYGFIEPDTLNQLNARCLFYPVAGEDCCDLLHVFFDYVDQFHFCDLKLYKDLRSLRPLLVGPAYRRIGAREIGVRKADIEQRKNGERPHKWITPGRLEEIYQRVCDGRHVTVVRRRGYGQYALGEFQDHSIGVFVHRGDSDAEGGSGTRFLANSRRDHEPLSNLLDKLSRKLSKPAFIISDGSNARPRFLRRFHSARGEGMEGEEAYTLLKREQGERGGPITWEDLDWSCVGYISPRYGPTLVWHVAQPSNG